MPDEGRISQFKPTTNPIKPSPCPACGYETITHDTAGSEHVRFETAPAGAWLETLSRMVRVGAGLGTHKLHDCHTVRSFRGGDVA